MTETYFLGANTRDGLRLLYDGFPPDDRARLHILKGGPGTGKSGFLRRIGKAAEERGLDVHYVLCSGDPGSLDGVYLPALREAWADGTAPHVLEPRIYGALGDYVHIGAFCRPDFTAEERDRLEALTKAYRACYGRAYRELAACGDLEGWRFDAPRDGDARARISSLGQRAAVVGRLTRRWISAVSCAGLIRLRGELEGLEEIPVSAPALQELAQDALQKGYAAIACLSPIDAERWEALLLPEAGLALTVFARPGDAVTPALDRALEALRQAKSLHDALEAVYRPHMDFAALDAFTEAQLRRIFP